eukprot:14265739-Alexandrium_andersonii.AAC.1
MELGCGNCNIAPSGRSLNCEGTGMASRWLPHTPKGCMLRRFSCNFRICPRKARFDEARGR